METLQPDADHGNHPVPAGDIVQPHDGGTRPPPYEDDVVVDVLGHGPCLITGGVKTFGQPSGVPSGTASLRCVDDRDHGTVNARRDVNPLPAHAPQSDSTVMTAPFFGV